MDTTFSFKQFDICQNEEVMKVGTDGVLLGCWASKDQKSKHILDVGCGTGLISLMMAQRFSSANIIAIDINPEAVRLAKINFIHSPWSDRLEARHIDFNKLTLESLGRLDMIVSNPPFFDIGTNATKKSRFIARQTSELQHRALLDHGSTLIKEDGNINIILPVDEARELVQYAPIKGLYLQRVMDVYSYSEKTPVRKLLEFSKTICFNPQESDLIIYSKPNHYTEAFISFTKDFYLHLS